MLQLCAQGKISLEDTITEYFPNLPYSGVTIKHLLSHTTGIPEYFKFKYPLYGSSAFVDNQQLLRVLEKQKYAKTFPTGSKFEYVNTNYAILAELVAKVSGKSFEEYVHENIFKPAGMKNKSKFVQIMLVKSHIDYLSRQKRLNQLLLECHLLEIRMLFLIQ